MLLKQNNHTTMKTTVKRILIKSESYRTSWGVEESPSVMWVYIYSRYFCNNIEDLFFSLFLIFFLMRAAELFSNRIFFFALAYSSTSYAMFIHQKDVILKNWLKKRISLVQHIYIHLLTCSYIHPGWYTISDI